jgi:hypothetical protein
VAHLPERSGSPQSCGAGGVGDVARRAASYRRQESAAINLERAEGLIRHRIVSVTGRHAFAIDTIRAHGARSLVGIKPFEVGRQSSDALTMHCASRSSE